MENPFFIRELRQHARGLFPALSLLSAGALLLAIAIPVLARDRAALPVLPLIAALHCLLCAAAGYHGGDRVTAAESRRSTLEGIACLPLPPLARLAPRLAFPLYLVGLVWVSWAPVYLGIVLLDLAPGSAVADLSRLPLLLGLGVVWMMLVLPLEYLDALPAGIEIRGRRFRLADTLLCCLLVCLLMGLTLQGLLRGSLPRLDLPLLPAGLFWLAGGAALLAGAAATAGLDAGGGEWEERRAFRLRLAALVFLCAGAFGVTGGVMREAARMLLIGLLMYLRWLVPPADRGRVPAELDRIEARWPNPMLIRDLRAFARGDSFRGAARTGAALFLLAAAGAAAAIRLEGWSAAAPRIDAWALMAGIVGAATLTMECMFLVPRRWQRETARDTLPLLLLTPLSSAQIVGGRLAAGLAWSLAANAPRTALLLAAVLWSLLRGSALAVAGLLAAFPWLVSLGLLTRFVPSKSSRPGWADFVPPALCAAQVGAALPLLKSAPGMDPDTLVVLGVGLGLWNAALTLAAWGFRVLSLEHARYRDG